METIMTLTQIARTIIFGLLLTLGNSAFAGDFVARISSILFYEQGDLIYIYVEGGTQNRPACAGSNGDYLSFSMKRPRAREYLSGLMFAYAAGKSVHFRTEGACVDQGVSDTIVYFSIIGG
jgi:hypothetical protein